MKALYIEKPGRTSIGDIAPPDPAHGEVLLRVRMVGLCGSDINTFRGKNPLVELPRIPGHEIAAVVEAAGPGVPDTFRPGMAVTLSPYTACGQCPACRRGRANACRNNQTLGVQRHGALTEFIAVPWQKLIEAPGLSLRELCLVEPLSVGFHAASRGRITAADTVAVFGCGAVGLGVVSGAAFRGARVIAVDIDKRKLDLARQAGAAESINPAAEPLPGRLAELTAGDGPDVIVEAVGSPPTYRAAVELVAFTGRVVCIGYAKQNVEFETRFFVQKELDILGSRNAVVEDFKEVVRMLAARKFPVDGTISRVTPFEGAGQAFADWDRDPAAFTKILVQVDGQEKLIS